MAYVVPQTTDLAGLGRVRPHGAGPLVLVLSNPQADPDRWAQPLVTALVEAGFEAVTFVHAGTGTGPGDVVADVVRLVELLGAGAFLGPRLDALRS